ncbi:MAG: hypothetical protein KC496_14565 [Anaerolineae bacterium]|nr:hypothetical protein [Anaerolineae bacterium]
MATLSSSITRKPQARSNHPVSTPFLEWLVALTGLLFVAGIFFDGWAHNHGRVDDSFFTIYHAVMYSAYGISALLFAGLQMFNVNKGYRWSHALPAGYMLGMVGVGIFAVGGFGDMLWHTAFGIEENLEALMSPTHLLLGMGAFLIAGTPFRSAWQRRDAVQGWKDLLPMIVSAIGMLSILTFFTQYTYFTIDTTGLIGRRPYGLRGLEDIFGIMAFLMPSAFITGFLLLMLRRWRLPFGSITFILLANALLMTIMDLETEGTDEYALVLALLVGGFLVSGLILDSFVRWLKPSAEREGWLRVFAALAPALLCLSMLGGLQLLGTLAGVGGLWWAIHMWMGLPTIAAIGGLLLSYLMLPPAIPEVGDVA